MVLKEKPMQKIKSDTSKIRKWLPLILCVLGISYCIWWVLGISHLEQIEDDEYVGKTLLIYPSAGGFTLVDSWYFGKRSGDSYFSSYYPNDEAQMFYRIDAKYQEYYHGFRRLFGKYGITKYLIEPVDGKTKNRLFFSEETIKACDPATGIKVDFVCK